MSSIPWELSPDRCFDANPVQRQLARQLYSTVKDLPIFSPHGHVPPALLADPDARFGTPTELLIIPDHYVFRMLYSQGIALADIGIASRDGTPVEADHRKIWQCFAEHFYLFRGTPTGLWLADELINVFGVTERLNGQSAQRIYDQIAAQLASSSCAPRTLLERFRIEFLATTDAATDTLEQHRRLHADGLPHIRPTFRPDAVMNITAANWTEQIASLSAIAGIDVVDYPSYIQALEQRRAFFQQHGAIATDHSTLTPYTARLSDAEIATIFMRAVRRQATSAEATQFAGHMLMEFARMSVEDGLVMQLHPGSLRNHNSALFNRFGPDTGSDIPVATEWTNNLRPLLNTYGSDPRLRLILFTLDESSYSRELAPLVGHYPALRLGPPWWFFDSVNGMRRYFDQVIETTGLYNTAGFNDDTRAFVSIPARHDVWRRVSCNWLAGLVVQGLLTEDEAAEMAADCAVGLAKQAYRVNDETMKRHL
jgi:glucuronate isomerase